MLTSIQPIVLVGGASRRFGRDKLREAIGPTGNDWLVDVPIRALREVFGPRVALVGDCHPDVAARGDLTIPDRYPAVGPAGGILSALEWSGHDVFVLAGDLPCMTAAVVRTIVTAALEQHASAWTVLADADGLEPCIGLYRQAVRATLAERVREGRSSLHDLVSAALLQKVPIDHRAAWNVNTPAALKSSRATAKRGVSR